MNASVKEFLECVKRYPNAVAVVENGSSITYQQFSHIVNSMADAFIPILKNTENKAVVIALNKGIEAYAAIFAALISGGYYVPLDLSLPAKRQLQILNLVAPAILISNKDLENLLPANTVFLDPAKLNVKENVEAQPPNSLAYIKFTSGSTGEPKGVMVSQKSVSNYVNWVKKSFSPTTSDRWSQHPNISFDISVTDIFGALTSGGSLYSITSQLDLVLPGNWIKNNKITIWNSVPSVLDGMAKMGEINHDNLCSVRFFNFCGEILYTSQVKDIFRANPNCIVQNTYGPTEATVACKAKQFSASNFNNYSDKSVELGSDIPGNETFIVNDELLISGVQLADGYWADDKKTKDFFRSMAVGEKSLRYYASGDLVRTNSNGGVFFVGRKDQQVKIRGHRVELSETTAALKMIGFKECVVCEIDGSIVAFVCDPNIDHAEVVSVLKQSLHPVSIPSKIVSVTELPRTKNFKIDVQFLINRYKNCNQS